MALPVAATSPWPAAFAGGRAGRTCARAGGEQPSDNQDGGDPSGGGRGRAARAEAGRARGGASQSPLPRLQPAHRGGERRAPKRLDEVETCGPSRTSRFQQRFLERLLGVGQISIVAADKKMSRFALLGIENPRQVRELIRSRAFQATPGPALHPRHLKRAPTSAVEFVHARRALELRLAVSRLNRRPPIVSTSLPAFPRSPAPRFRTSCRAPSSVCSGSSPGPDRATVLLMMLMSLSLRALSVLQFYAMRAHHRHRRPAGPSRRRRLGRARPPLFSFFVVVAAFMVVEWGVWSAPLQPHPGAGAGPAAGLHLCAAPQPHLLRQHADRQGRPSRDAAARADRHAVRADQLGLRAAGGAVRAAPGALLPRPAAFAAILLAWLVVYVVVTVRWGGGSPAWARSTATPRRS